MNVLAAVLALLAQFFPSPGPGHAPYSAGGGGGDITCSSTPCASDGSNSACDTLSEIDAKIDAAADNDVVCLKRGSTWSSSSTALTFGTHHPGGSRVLLCASDSTTCTDSGAANPQITITDGTVDGITFSSTGDGYTIQDLDLVNSGTISTSAQAYGDLPGGLQDVSFLGGDMSGWLALMIHDIPGTDIMQNMEFGTCDHVLTFHNGFRSSPIALWYGACKTCNISMHVYDWGTTTENVGQTHMIDLTIGSGAPRPTKDPTHESSDVTVSCSHFETDPGQTSNGFIIKAAAGVRLVVRDNWFDQLDGAVGDASQGGVDPGEACPGAINFGGHTGPPTNYEWGFDGAEIYRNIFAMKNCFQLQTLVGKNINIYNNLIISDWDTGDWKSYPIIWTISGSTGCTIGGCTLPDNTHFYNNSIFMNVNGTGTGSNGHGDFHFAGAAGTNHSFFNNVLQDNSVSNGDGAIIVSDGDGNLMTGADCDKFGSSGTNIHDNYFYTPNDSTPVTGIANCTSASNNPTTYTTNPGLDDPTNTGKTAVDRLKITAADTLLWKMGSSGAPATDYLNLTRPSPASIGGLDVPP